MPRDARWDNQIATYLMIDLKSGFAPAEYVFRVHLMLSETHRDDRYQQQVGTVRMGSELDSVPLLIALPTLQVVVMRADYKPLTKEQIETIWMYHDRVLDLFGDGAEPAHAFMNKQKFRLFCERYKEECIQNGKKEFEGLALPI